VTSLEVMGVGGGGGGGGDGGDGGGGGELRQATITVTSADVLSITAGTGGAGGRWATTTNGADGSSSSVMNGSTTLLRAIGGSGGTNFNLTNGGQGFGGFGGTGGTGSNGGNGGTNSNTIPTQGTNGSNGPTSLITGTLTNYGGGGGGGIYLASPGAPTLTSRTGGLGGGGLGAYHTTNVGDFLGTQGDDGTGGGGGAGSSGNGATETSEPPNNEIRRLLPGLRGGHGIVIISYTTPPATTTTTSTTTTSTSTTTSTTTTTTTIPAATTTIAVQATTSTSTTIVFAATRPVTRETTTTTTTSTPPNVVRTSVPPSTPTQTTTAPQLMPKSSDLFAAVDTEPEFFDVALVTTQTATIKTARITGSAVGLLPGSTIRIIMRSDPITLGEVVVDKNGGAEFDLPLPADAPEGDHSITVEGESGGNEAITALTAFSLTETGIIDDIIEPTEIIGADIEAFNLEGSRQFGVPVYDTTRNVGQTAAIATTAVLVTSLVGAAASSLGSTSSPTSGSRSTSGSSTNTEGRFARREDDDVSSDDEPTESTDDSETDTNDDSNENTEGSFTSTDANMLNKSTKEELGFGDNKQTWFTPGFSIVDAIVRFMVRTFSSRSVLVTRIAQDGHWLRTSLGSLAGLLWVAGILAGFASAVNTNFHVGLPVAWLALAIIALSLFDAFASALAWVTFTIACIVTGNVTGIYEFRTLMGLAIVWIALPSIASAIRPMVRVQERSYSFAYDRLADYVVMPLFASYAAASAYSALNGLSGLTLVSSTAANQVRILVIACCVARLLVEDAVQLLYPKRSAEIFIEPTTSQRKSSRLFTITASAILYLIAAGPFFGFGWRTWLIVSLMSVVPLGKLFSSSFPNFPRIHRWFPRGVVRSALMIFVSAWFARFIFEIAGQSHNARTLAVFLLIPGIVIGIIDCIARDSRDWPSTLFTKISGIGLWLFLAAVLTGNLAI
jgi:hypothetical protein